MEREKKNSTDIFKKCSKKTKIILIALASIFLVAIIYIIIFSPSGKTSYSVKSSLREVLETSELSTAEYTYNSIAKVKIDAEKPEDEDNIKYLVAYKGTVKSGVDFKKIDIVEKENSVIVVVPKIEILSVSVDTDLDYIFSKKKYDTEKTYAEAYNACCEDLEIKAKNNKTLYNTAIESAVETVTAITKPFKQKLDGDTTIQVVYIDNYDSEGKE